MKFLLSVTAFTLVSFAFFNNAQSLQAAGGSIPPWPVIYTGSVTLGGAPAPDGLWIVGRMDGYTSVPLEISGGRMSGLAVGAPDQTFFGKTITFELRSDPNDPEGATVAEQTDTFAKYPLPTLKKDFDLTFPAFPTPTPLPTATPTATPVATATPLATATPIVVGAVVYNGVVVASGAVIPEGASLTARIGTYESNSVPVVGGRYLSLIVDLNDPDLTGATVNFYLNGTEARTTAIYEVGSTIRNVDLIFTDLPIFNTPEPAPVDTPAAPVSTATVVAVTIAAPVAPTPAPTPAPAPAPAVNTAVPTQIPAPTAEPIVLVVTATPAAEETPLPAEESGGCFAVADVDPLTGTANVLAMIGPLLLLVAYRGFRKLR